MPFSLVLFRPYLREIGVELSLQAVPLLLELLVLGLDLAESLLRLSDGVEQLVSLVQHRHHQLLEVGVVAAELRAPLRDAVLSDGGHHVTHHIPHVGWLNEGVES